MLTNNFAKNIRVYPRRHTEPLSHSSLITLPGPVEPKQNKIIQPPYIEQEQRAQADLDELQQAIHEALTEDDIIDDIVDDDDCNDWGGLEALFANKEDEEYFNDFTNKDGETFKWILPSVLAVRAHPIYCSLKDPTFLQKKGIKAIVSLFETPLKKEYIEGMEYLFIPTQEGTVSKLKEICEFISKMEEQNKPVFVHCSTGYGATGAVLAAYLIYKKYLEADEAIEWVRIYYDMQAIETHYQEDELQYFADHLEP